MTTESALDAAILRNLLAQTTRAYDKKLAELFAETELATVTLESIGDGVLTTGPEGKVGYLNPVAAQLTGWEPAEAVGRRLDEVLCLVHEEDGTPVVLPTAADLAAAGARTATLQEVLLVSADGSRRAVQATAAPIRGRLGGTIGLIVVFRDVSETRLMALQLAHQASHDQLTGLLNRQAFEDRLGDVLAPARPDTRNHSLCYLDVDQFKLVNDTCGHIAGDELLRRLAGVLTDHVRESDVLARLGGDEFGLLLIGCEVEPARRIATALCEAFSSFRFAWEDKVFQVTVSIGVVPIVAGIGGTREVLAAADHACYLAKERGRSRVQVYQRDDRDMALRVGEMSLAVKVEKALEENGFRLFAQPLMPLSPRVEGRWCFEVLLRLAGEDGGLYPPAQFIRAAERYGLMPRVDRWVVREALRQLALMPTERLERLHRCFINLSGVSLGDESFPAFVRKQLQGTAIPPQKLCFEVTETAAVQSIAKARRTMDELIAAGCGFALDDFGQGMSSYGYLKNLPVSYVKIDGIFVKDMVADRLDRAMVESINQIGHLLGLETVAESVSSAGLLELVQTIGIDFAQGFHLGVPRPLEEILTGAAPLRGD